MAMFTVTIAAAEQIRKSMPENETPALRIAAKMMPDGNVEVGMGFDEQREFDFEVVTNGINVLIGSSSRDILEGVTLDFQEIQPGDFNFVFIPPEDKRPAPSSGGGCGAPGCGSGGCGGGAPNRPRCK
jgi:iron-sulfur cluster assembly protein